MTADFSRKDAENTEGEAQGLGSPSILSSIKTLEPIAYCM